MIDSTFSRATWLNSLHMSTLTLSLLEKEGFAREQLLEGSGITPADLLDLRRLISPWQEQQVFANACRPPRRAWCRAHCGRSSDATPGPRWNCSKAP